MASKAFVLFLAVNLVLLSVASAYSPYGATSTTSTQTTTPRSPGGCSLDLLKLGVCADVLGLIRPRWARHRRCHVAPSSRGSSTSRLRSASAPPSRPTCSASSSTSPLTSASSLTTAARTCPAASSADQWHLDVYI